MSGQSPTQPRPAVRYRAAKACRRCNEKRVKCDAVERGTPCTRCTKRNEPECVLIQSRRGIYARKPRRTDLLISDSRDKPGDAVCSRSRSRSLSSSCEIQHQSMTQRDLDDDRSGTVSRGEGDMASSALRNEPSAGSISHVHGEEDEFPPATKDLTLAANPELATPTSGDTETSNSSYREISWTTMFDHFLEGQQKGEDVIDKCSITYLGESFPLAIVLKDFRGGGGRPKLHHPGPPCPENEPQAELQSMHHPAYMHAEDIVFLNAKKAFEAPERETMDALIGVFLDRVFPLYPIVNRQEFLQQYKAKRVPWILLHALCFISATYCPSSILYRARFETRRQARFSFYSKAKALFDTGYEGNKIVVLQVAILMSFWGGGPNNYWNFYSWISTGVTIAETLGFHRSMAGTNMMPQDRSLLKRLWWILVVRDATCAALVGRPFRINLDHCDVDSLTVEDFQYEVESPGFATNPQRHVFGLYQIQITKLSLILRRIITTRFYPRGLAVALSPLRDMLTEWRSQLPPLLDWSDNVSISNVFSSCLSIVYNHHLILAHLNCSPETTTQSSPPGTDSSYPSSEEISNAAAQRIASTACAIVTKSDVLLMPHELFHGIFLAEVVFYTQTKSPRPVIAQLGRAGLTNCQMALHESRESWDPSPWIMQLFDKLLWTPPSEGHPRPEEDDQNGNVEILMDSTTGIFDVDGIFSAGYDLWQSHPVLGNLFDMPLEGSVMQPPLGDGSGFSSCFDTQTQFGMPG